MTALLEVDGVSRLFKGLRAIDNVSLTVNVGEIVGLIGPNGAGKTTLVNVVTGMYPATAGRVRLDGRDITRVEPNRIAELGVARTFQIVQPFRDVSVLENVIAGVVGPNRETWIRTLRRWRS